jgi:hypothetical protein
MPASSAGKSSIDRWMRHFRAGTVINALRANGKAARRFFGALPVMRSNVLELYLICFAHQILSFRDDELASKFEAVKKAAVLAQRPTDDSAHFNLRKQQRTDTRGFGDVRQVSATRFSGSVSPWFLACPSIPDPNQSTADSIKELRSWATAILKASR